MQQYLLRRVLHGVASILLMTVVVFFLARLAGNPVYLMVDAYASDEDVAMLSQRLGLDKPLPIQYWKFISNMARGDFGDSIRMKRPALELVLERFPATLSLAGTALAITMLIAVPVGVLSAVKRDTWIDLVGKVVALLGQAVPVFWLGLVLILIFAVRFGILPSAGTGSLKHLILPAVTLGWFAVAGVMRLTRSGMLDVLGSEYVKLARIKGVSEAVVIWKHCFKNAAVPVVTFSGVIFVHLLTGSIITETIFAWPGVGRLAYQSVLWRDFPLIQTIVLLMSVVYITVNLLIDVLYAYLNPRIRYR